MKKEKAIKSILLVEEEILIAIDLENELFKQTSRAIWLAKNADNMCQILASSSIGIQMKLMILDDDTVRGDIFKDAWEVAAKLRHSKIARESNLPIIITTTRNTVPEPAENIIAIFKKPYRKEDIVAKVQKILSQ